MNNPAQFPLSARIFHWGMAALIFSMLLAGLSMVQTLQAWHAPIVAAHKFFGVLALIAVIARLANRFRFKSPALPADLPAAQKLAAMVTQALLYICMFAMPITGFLMVSASGQGINMLGLFTLPPIGEPSLVGYSFFRELHAITAVLLMLLIVMHVTAAVYHGLIRNDNVLRSMLR